tara:strand:- start:329 stop:796 length:468 start_codon:yes stop_codon:yes gene_type:complete
MRFIFLIALAFLISPAFAHGGEQYSNARFGYSIDVPAGFVSQGESDNGDGQRFVLPGRAIELEVWGGWTRDFDSEVANRMAQDSAAGWNQTYQAITPRWASWSATAGGQIVYQRMIALCDGQSFAAFRAEYGTRDRVEMDPVVERLVASLRGSAC